MSRETDSSSSGPQGRAGAAYPSGTPPYGSPAQGATPDGGPDGAGPGAGGERSDEPKTETTLTTRIRINIPGSRPIPPVVMRTPVGDSDGDRGVDVTRADGGRGAGAGASAQDGAGASGPSAGDASAASPGPSASASLSSTAAASAASPGASGGSASASGSAAPPQNSAGGGDGGDGGEKASDWFAPRRNPGPKGGGASSGPAGSSGPSGASGASGPSGSSGTSAPPSGSGASGSGTGSGGYDVSGAVAAGPLGSGGPHGGESPRGDLPYFSGGEREDEGEYGSTGPAGPAGPTGGPVTGDAPMLQPGPPGGQGGHPERPGGSGPGRLSDDTAILTPQKPVPGSGGRRPPGAGAPGPGGPGGNVSGDTLTSGIPVVPPAQNSPFAPGAHLDEPGPHTPPKLPEPAKKSAPTTPAKKPAKKKGRSKLVLLAGVAVVLGCGAYGAGLLMNHADVPKGTTVLGVDIGGGTRDEAVKKLDAALGERVNKPLKLTVGGDQVTLKPDQAGLTLDSQATVRAAAGSDYNPVSVIGGLFGGERVVDPVMPVDEEKLTAALERAAGGSGTAKEGTVKFVPGKAVPVYGKAGQGIDSAKASTAVAEAYEKQVETGSAGTVTVPVTNRKPTVSNAEVDDFMKRFAKPAMSANVTVKAGNVSIPFGPSRSLPKVLGVKVVSGGKLSQTYDLVELKKLYGNIFDGVYIERANGEKTPVQPTDVALAMGKALQGRTPAERVGVIETDPN